GMVLDRVDSFAETVVRPQLGGVAVRLGSEHLHALATDELAHLGCPEGDPPASLALHRVLERSIARPGVVADQGRRLIRRFRVPAKIGHAAYCSGTVRSAKISRYRRKKANEMADAAKEIATLAGGCFWCLEAVFDELKGVESVVSGYMGGKTANPTYEE